MNNGTVSIEGYMVVISTYYLGQLINYAVDVESSLTLSEWITQLRDKRWFTSDLESQFIKAFNLLKKSTT